MNRMVNQEENKKFLIIFGAVFLISIVVFIWLFISINNRFKENASIGLLTINTTESLVPNDNTTLASATQDKTINEVANTLISQTASGKTANISSSQIVSDNTADLTTNKTEAIAKKQSSSVIDETAPKKELSFMAPCVGEIITDYADESLVYSKTLDEWTTHLGIDIKANKTSSVVSAESGTVKSIKNDPRFGLTIIILHDDGYETVYANLLSADFVKEGENVNKNQPIATVGESASFEVSDPPHLHFEILKNGEPQNPTTLIK